MKVKVKNGIIAAIYATLLGAAIGSIVWVFLRLMNLGIDLVWETIPGVVEVPFYTLIVCLIGGLVIGIWRKKVDTGPEGMEAVIMKVRKNGKYPYDRPAIRLVSAFLPLVFGGSVGPEAGLTGIIAGLCCWVSDKFKKFSRRLQSLTKIGLSATLGTIFNAPMFGFIMPFESEDDKIEIPKTSKVIFYLLAIFGAFGALILLGDFFGRSGGLTILDGFTMGNMEWFWLIPLCVVGAVMGILYFAMRGFTDRLAKLLENKPVISCLLAGLLLGGIGMVLPLTMFSGEEQVSELIVDWSQIGGLTLIMIGIIKLFVTNACISLGIRGGHFYPSIFSGICIGYGIATFIGVNPIFCACVITTALMSFMIKKPLATVFLLLICFSSSAIPVMLLAAATSTVVAKIIKK